MVVVINKGPLAEGMTYKDYVKGAYAEYRRKLPDNQFDVGLLLYYIVNDWDIYNDICIDEFSTQEECANAAINAYLKFNQQNNTYFACNNIALIYKLLNDYTSARAQFKLAIENNEDINFPIDNYKSLILALYNNKLTLDETLALMDDIIFLYPYTNNDLALSTLLGTLSIYTGTKMDETKEILSNADAYYNAGHTLTKILLATLDAMTGIDATSIADKIVRREVSGHTLDPEESLYFARYYFTIGRYDNAYGYLSDRFRDASLESARVIMLTEAFLKGGLEKNNAGTLTSSMLYQALDDSLTNSNWNRYGNDYKLLSVVHGAVGCQLGNISEADFYAIVKETGLSNDFVQFFFAVAAFNSAQYQDAIKRCDAILSELTDTSAKTLDVFYLRLVRADACYQYALTLKSGEPEWQEYMSQAQTECDYFNASTKAFRYIQEKFSELEQNINIAEGNLGEVLKVK